MTTYWLSTWYRCPRVISCNMWWGCSRWSHWKY